MAVGARLAVTSSGLCVVATPSPLCAGFSKEVFSSGVMARGEFGGETDDEHSEDSISKYTGSIVYLYWWAKGTPQNSHKPLE